MTEQEKSKKQLQQVADLAETIGNDIGNLAGTACLLRIELDDSEKIYPIHRQTMATIQTLLERLEADTEKLTDYLAQLQHEKMKRDVVVVPMSKSDYYSKVLGVE